MTFNLSSSPAASFAPLSCMITVSGYMSPAGFARARLGDGLRAIVFGFIRGSGGGVGFVFAAGIVLRGLVDEG